MISELFIYHMGVFTCLSLCLVCQSESLVVCDVDEKLVERLKKFRLRTETNNAAIISECSTQCTVRSTI